MVTKLSVSLLFIGLFSMTLGNEEYSDHDHQHQFLGEFAKSLNKSPEELEELLYWLVQHRIDQNKDMKINLGELKHWMRHVYHTDLTNSAIEAFNECNHDLSSYLSFKDHRACVHAKPDIPAPTEKSDLKMINRWRLADADHDNRLNMNEFESFWVPEEAHNQKMHGLLVSEYIEERDSDDDHQLTLQEWLSLGTDEHEVGYPSDEFLELQPEERFPKMDENKDGTLSHPELEHYLFPFNDDPADQDARHILAETDDDKDGKISHKEMLKHLKVFVGSEVFRQGKVLMTHRDEL